MLHTWSDLRHISCHFVTIAVLWWVSAHW